MSKGQKYFPKLFEKGLIRRKEVKNRVVMPAMAGCVGDTERVFSDELIAYFEERARNGVGIIITEGMIVSNDNGISVAAMVRLNNPRNDFQLEKFAETIHRYDTLVFAQLLHAGSVSIMDPSINKELVGPSALPGSFYLPPPRELTHEEIVQLEDDFVRGAVKCYQAKLDGVELHGAHGYLINQFMSPLTNQRTDEYGGSFENRMRFTINVLNKARAVVSNDFIIGIRINGDDFTDGGMNSEMCVEVARSMEKAGFDYISVSSGTYGSMDLVHIDDYRKPTFWKNSYILPIKNAIKTIPVFAVNTIKTPAQAEKALQDGIQDFVCIGRGLLADPEFVSKAETGRADEVHNCIACLRCIVGLENYWETRCSVNPRLGRETVFRHMDKNGNGRNAVVIGAGPGGIMAAKTLADKGFVVTLYEKHKIIGGALLIGSTTTTGKNLWVQWVNSWDVVLKKLGVKIKVNTEVKDLKEIKALKPYIVVLATGGNPITPNIPGIDQPNVVQAHSVLSEEVKIENKNVAIIGSGLTGLETCDYLLRCENKVTFFDMLDEIAKGAPAMKMLTVMALMGQGVQFNLLHKLKRINKDEVVFDDIQNGGEKIYKADMIVLSMGVQPEVSLKDKLNAEFDKVTVIGDAHGGKLIWEAVIEAYGKMWVL